MPFGPDNNDHMGMLHSEYTEELRTRLRRAHAHARKKTTEATLRKRRLYHRTAKTFEVGTKVMLFMPRLRANESSKLNTT
jgi:hypothetical protein